MDGSDIGGGVNASALMSSSYTHPFGSVGRQKRNGIFIVFLDESGQLIDQPCCFHTVEVSVAMTPARSQLQAGASLGSSQAVLSHNTVESWLWKPWLDSESAWSRLSWDDFFFSSFFLSLFTSCISVCAEWFAGMYITRVSVVQT